MLTKQKVLEVLSSAGLPTNVNVEIRDLPRMQGSYVPVTDTLTVSEAATDSTIVHEGAHAEHWGFLGLRGRSPTTLAAGIGVALGSEVYVGRRTVDLHGCLAHEQSRIMTNSAIPEKRFTELIEGRFDTRRGFVGEGWRGGFLRAPAFRATMIASTLLGMELQRRDLNFFAGLEAAGNYSGLLVRLVGCLSSVDLLSAAALADLGTRLLEEAGALGVSVTSYDDA